MPEAAIPSTERHQISSPLSPLLLSPKPANKPADKPVAPPSPPRLPSKSPSPLPEEPAPDPDKVPQPPPDPSKSQDADVVNMDTFRQILELDDDSTHEFSKGMAWAFFSQAEQTFKDMDDALAGENLAKLSSLGHFLKGSSAALGLSKVQASCEKIQHYGQRRDEVAGEDVTESVALEKIKGLLSQVNDEYAVAESWLKDWYEKNSEDSEPQTELS